MKPSDPLRRLEELLPRAAADAPPPVNVLPRVMRRVCAAQAQTEPDRALMFFALGSCLLAAVVLMVGLSVLQEPADPMGAFFQIVPPIEF
mgnify:CR=1 FL=1